MSNLSHKSTGAVEELFAHLRREGWMTVVRWACVWFLGTVLLLSYIAACKQDWPIVERDVQTGRKVVIYKQ